MRARRAPVAQPRPRGGRPQRAARAAAPRRAARGELLPHALRGGGVHVRDVSVCTQRRGTGALAAAAAPAGGPRVSPRRAARAGGPGDPGARDR